MAKKKSSPDAFVYNATLDRIIDGDTFDCILDLGFDVKLHKQRVRLAGIDTPESRTRDLAEKVNMAGSWAFLMRKMGRTFVKCLLRRVTPSSITAAKKLKFGETIK
jgi:endonuclease YncB( thermonuclease family)